MTLFDAESMLQTLKHAIILKILHVFLSIHRLHKTPICLKLNYDQVLLDEKKKSLPIPRMTRCKEI